jgi:hypothetical protein
MDRQRWAEIESLYQDALERDRTERSVWLQQACGDDTDLLREVESLLACADPNLSKPILSRIVFWRATARNFRLLTRLLTQIERVLSVNELQTVSAAVVEAARDSLVIGPG